MGWYTLADISLPEGMSQEEFLEHLKDYLKRGKDYRLIVREPGGERGKGMEKGTLKELRELVKDMEESGELVEGSMVYITVSRYGGSYGGGVYEGYEVVDGKLVKSYREKLRDLDEKFREDLRRVPEISTPEFVAGEAKRFIIP